MTVERVRQALERAETERDAVEQRADAFARFERELQEVSPETAPTAGGSGHAAGGTVATARGDTSGGCRRVRELFAETVRPHSTADVPGEESLRETIGEEFSEQIAAALTPQTSARFTPDLKGTVVSAAATRRRQTEALARALDTEAESLRAALERLDAIEGRLSEDRLLALGFDALAERHERLADARDRCDSLARERQQAVHDTTNYEGIGLTHQSLAAYLYEEFPSSHPVLSTVVWLDARCAERQREVRDHLTRRV